MISSVGHRKLVIIVCLLLKGGKLHVIWAYHSKGPDSMTTLDSLAPESLGSKSIKLLCPKDEYGREMSDDAVNKVDYM